MIACIIAVRNSVPPYFVFPRIQFKKHTLHGSPHHVIIINHQPSHKVLLLLDNHKAHIAIDGINKAKNNGFCHFDYPSAYKSQVTATGQGSVQIFQDIL